MRGCVAPIVEELVFGSSLLVEVWWPVLRKWPAVWTLAYRGRFPCLGLGVLPALDDGFTPEQCAGFDYLCFV